jgi:hypothetical protein
LCPRAYLRVPDHCDPHLLPCCGYLPWRSSGLNTDSWRPPWGHRRDHLANSKDFSLIDLKLNPHDAASCYDDSLCSYVQCVFDSVLDPRCNHRLNSSTERINFLDLLRFGIDAACRADLSSARSMFRSRPSLQRIRFAETLQHMHVKPKECVQPGSWLNAHGRLLRESQRQFFGAHGRLRHPPTTSTPRVQPCRAPRLLVTRPHRLYVNLAVRREYSF